MNITHEVWDEESNCPDDLHGIAQVTVRIVDDDVASTSVMLQAQPPSVAENAGPTRGGGDGDVETVRRGRRAPTWR